MSIFPRRKIRWRYKLLLLLVVFGVLIFWPHGNLVNQFKETVSQGTVLQKNEEKDKQAALAAQKKLREQKQQQLLTTVRTELSVNNKFGVAVYDINNAEAFGISELEQFHAASVMKLLVATTAFTDIEAGKYPLSNTTRYNLQQMINQSNNNSWEYFNQLQGFGHQQVVADNLQLTNVKVWGNLMSAKGVAELLLKLYKGEILTEEHRKLFLS